MCPSPYPSELGSEDLFLRVPGTEPSTPAEVSDTIVQEHPEVFVGAHV